MHRSSRHTAPLLKTPRLKTSSFNKLSLSSLLLGAVLVSGLLSISGCNTIRGAGEDIEQGGAALERSAEG